MSRVSQTEHHELDVWLPDIETFLAVYTTLTSNAANHPASKFTTYSALFEAVGRHYAACRNPSTIVQRLARVVRVFCGHVFTNKKKEHAKRRGIARGWSGFELLFAKDAGNIQPTDAAERLFHHFQNLKDVCERARHATTQILQNKDNIRIVRLGLPHTVSLYIMPYILSGWSDLFRNDWIKIEPEVASTRQLISRLAIGLLDCVIAYGSDNEKSYRTEARLPIDHLPLEFSTRMVLLANPRLKLRMAKIDKNDGNEQRVTTVGTGMEDLTGDKIRNNEPPEGKSDGPYDHIPRENKVMFEQLMGHYDQALIAVPSWEQSRTFQKVINNWKKHNGKVIFVMTFDEALSMVRMNAGVTANVEVYALRKLVTPYRLEPIDDYKRSLCQYYNTNFPLMGHSQLLVAFINTYFSMFSRQLRFGEPPASGAADYELFIEKFTSKDQFKQYVQAYVDELKKNGNTTSDLIPYSELHNETRSPSLSELEAVRILDLEQMSHDEIRRVLEIGELETKQLEKAILKESAKILIGDPDKLAWSAVKDAIIIKLLCISKITLEKARKAIGVKKPERDA